MSEPLAALLHRSISGKRYPRIVISNSKGLKNHDGTKFTNSIEDTFKMLDDPYWINLDDNMYCNDIIRIRNVYNNKFI